MKKSILVALAASALFFGAGCQSGQPSTSPAPTSNQPVPTPTTNVAYTMEDVAKHATQQDCWTVIDGKVYNITSAIDKHPGGPDTIIKGCGVDGTGLFNSIKGGAGHPPKANENLQQYQVGYLK